MVYWEGVRLRAETMCVGFLWRGGCVTTAAWKRLLLISNQSKAWAQGHIWTQPFSALLSPLFYPLPPRCPHILTCHPVSLFHYVLFSLSILSITSYVFPTLTSLPASPIQLPCAVFYQLIRSFCSSSNPFPSISVSAVAPPSLPLFFWFLSHLLFSCKETTAVFAQTNEHTMHTHLNKQS